MRKLILPLAAIVVSVVATPSLAGTSYRPCLGKKACVVWKYRQDFYKNMKMREAEKRINADAEAVANDKGALNASKDKVNKAKQDIQNYLDTVRSVNCKGC